MKRIKKKSFYKIVPESQNLRKKIALFIAINSVNENGMKVYLIGATEVTVMKIR